MDDWEVIFNYSRAQAIEDGVLIPVDPEMAKEAGFKVPIALTSTLYDKYIKSDLPGQDETGRLWDTLIMLHIKAKWYDDSILQFFVTYQMQEDKAESVELKAVIGPGDTPDPVLTIMLPHED